MFTGYFGLIVAGLSAIILREPTRNVSKKYIKEVENDNTRTDSETNRISIMIDEKNSEHGLKQESETKNLI